MTLTERHWNLAGKLVSGKITGTDFCAAFSISPTEAMSWGHEILCEAAKTKDGDAVEFGLLLAHNFGFTQQHVGVLQELALLGWHTQHENIVDGLAKLRTESSVAILYSVAREHFGYLDYDETFALGVKCVWALGDLGGEAAIARLAELQAGGNEILAENAVEQLLRLRSEGASEVIRDAAEKALARSE